MRRQIVVSTTVALLLSIATLSIKAQEKREPWLTNEAFGVLVQVMSADTAEIEGEKEFLLEFLRDNGFQQTPPGSLRLWVKNDRMGYLEIQRQQKFTGLQFVPAVAQSTAAPVLAALIAKAESVIVLGDKVELALSPRPLSGHRGGGVLTQYIQVSLSGGRVVEISSLFKWTD